MGATDEAYAVEKIATTDAAAVLDRLAGTDLMERGSVVMISVDAIRQRAGERWSRKCDDVWAYVERRLTEHLSHHDLRQRVSETDFLVAMTSEDGPATQAVCMTILEEVLTHFLGAAEKVDLKIRSVTSIEDGVLGCTELDPARIRSAPKPEAGLLRGVDPEEVRRRNPVSFVVASGQRMRIDFSVEPVISLRNGVTAALRIRPTVTSETTGILIPARGFGKLADDDIAFIDRASLDYAALFLAKPAAGQPVLIIPASFRTMATRRGRAMLAAVENVTPDQMKAGAIIELIDVDRGTPPGRLAEITSLVGQLARGVMIRLHPSRDGLAMARSTRMQGLILDMAELDLGQTQLARLFKLIRPQVQGAAPSVMALGLPQASNLQLAKEAGFTHAGVRTALENAARSSAA